MIVQACINGNRPASHHPALPLNIAAMASDSRACVAAGAAEIHVHPRDATGRESLGAVAETVRALRAACPGTLIGVSTGAWIERDAALTRAAIEHWTTRPDYASVNLAEPDAPAVMATLARMGVGIEAGLATVADAERFVALPSADRTMRVLIEIELQEAAAADAEADGIARTLDRAGLRRPILLHGCDALVWHFVARARQARWSTRVGLEDGRLGIDGRVTASNAAMVADAIAAWRAAD